ncbi:MAG: hypothetical protein DMG16_15950, partial [Acidobacteria bacterium]
MINHDELRELAARASTIRERLGGDYEPGEPAGEIERVRARDRLAAWRQSVTAGNYALFAGWLAHQGLDEADAVAILGRVRLKTGKALPQWATACAWAMPAMGSATDVPLPEHGESDNDKHVPFEQLLWPVVQDSWSKLKLAVGNLLLQRWSRPACVDLQRGLLRRLSIALAWPLYTDFNLFRHFWRYARGNLNWVLLSPDSATIYESFLAEWRNGRWREFFLEKPVAARLLGTIVSSWLDTTAELLQRLHRDADRLGNVFGGGRKPGRVTSILTDRSDPHGRGRTVAILHFSNGLTLVYKPKDLGVDAAWEGLMQWMEWRGAPVALQTPAVLPCDGYGWTTHVVANPCAPASNSALFYRRAGSLLAVLHLLRGDDFHSDNVITSMDSPVPIDFETLLHPVMNARLADHHSDPAIAAAIELIGSSVSGTHYLPQVRRWPNGRIQAFGGIEAGFRPQPDSVSFRHINTDAMERVRHEPTPEDETAAVKTTNSLSQLTDHTESIVDGFSEMYTFFLQHQSELVSPSGPLRRFRDVRVRVVLEETSIYEFVAEQAAAVPNLTDGADWSLHFDLLARRKISSAMSPQRAAVRAAELCALANLDIPHFSARTDADGIDICRGDHIEHCLAGSPFNQLLAHIARFGAADLARQVRLIRLMLARRPTHPAAPAKAHSVRLATARLSPLAEAGRLGELLASAAIRAGESAAWIGPAPVDHEHRNVRVAGPDLYSGAAGIALFLAALAHITGEARFRELAFGALYPARDFREAAEGSALAARLLGIGGATGISSLIYGLVR